MKIEDVRQQYDIRSVLGLAENKRVIVCPLPNHRHQNNTPSFSIYTKNGMQYWKCHGSCNCEGDVIDLVGYLRLPGYNRRNPTEVYRAVELLTNRFEAGVVIHEKETRLIGDTWRNFLPPDDRVVEYAVSRGLSYATIVSRKLGQWKNYMTIPNFEEERLIGVKLRRIDEGEPRFFSLKGSKAGLFNYDDVNMKSGSVLIVKGEIPCMLLNQHGFLSCAPTGGEGSHQSSERWRIALALANKIVVGDNDDAGRRLGKSRAEMLGAKLVFPPPAYKDIDQYFLAEPQAATDQIKRWMEI